MQAARLSRESHQPEPCGVRRADAFEPPPLTLAFHFSALPLHHLAGWRQQIRLNLLVSCFADRRNDISRADRRSQTAFTSDDAMQSYTLEVLDFFFANRKNPNGCPVKTTFFNSLSYNNYSMVTD